MVTVTAIVGFVKPKNGPGSCAEQGLMGNVVLRMSSFWGRCGGQRSEYLFVRQDKFKEGKKPVYILKSYEFKCL